MVARGKQIIVFDGSMEAKSKGKLNSYEEVSHSK